MKRRNLLTGIIIASVIIASGLAVIQSQKLSYAEPPLERPAFVSPDTEEADVMYEETAESARGFELFPSGEKAGAPQEPKIIKTSYIYLEVKSFHTAADEVGAIARKYSGYVSDSSVQDYEGRKTGYVIIRIPQTAFEDVIKEIEQIGTLKEENVSLEDVTEQYIDVEARLENFKRQEQRYLEILDIAETVEDILEVEQQLERIRGNIESLQGQLNYLDNRIDLSTIHVQLAEPEEVVHDPGIGGAFSSAVDAFLAVIRGIIIFLGYFIPIVIFMGILAFSGMYIYKKVSKGS